MWDRPYLLAHITKREWFLDLWWVFKGTISLFGVLSTIQKSVEDMRIFFFVYKSKYIIIRSLSITLKDPPPYAKNIFITTLFDRLND